MASEKIEYLNLDLLHPFKNNPFQSVDESEYDELRETVVLLSQRTEKQKSDKYKTYGVYCFIGFLF